MSGTAAELSRRNRDLADACLEHPFAQGIASGELPRERFQVYVVQDACFLEAFARAYALALARCPDREGLAVFKDSPGRRLRGAPPAPGLRGALGHSRGDGPLEEEMA